MTGISYGQLYRWKRQNLIPESWFIKQSSVTGQETYFVKDLILKRVEFILEHKDQYSLEELATMLSPEQADRSYTSDEVRRLEGIDSAVVTQFERVLEKAQFTYLELLFITTVSQVKQELQPSDDVITDLVWSIRDWLPHQRSASCRLVVCKRGEQIFTLLIDQDSTVFPDTKTERLNSYDLSVLSQELKLQLQTGLV
jgi:DNA-binding transcriptional MerR regulator